MISQADNAKIKNIVTAIVAKGENLRARVSEVVTNAADKAATTPTGLIDLSRSVLDGAIAALDKSVSRDPDSILRQVIDGLGDGLSTTALATRLAMEEAKAEQKRFAEEDLSTTTRDLRAVGERFVDTISQATGKFKSMTGTELSALRQHAEQTMKRLLPSINAALATIQEHPLQFGRESVGAGVQLSRQALGSLFAAIGRQFQKAAKQLTGEGSVK